MASTPAILSLRSLGREFREHLPVWFFYFQAIGLLHAALANFPDDGFEAVGIPREHFIPTLIFPMIPITAYLLLRIRHSRRIRAPWKAYLFVAVMIVGIPLLIIFGYRPMPLTHDQLAMLFEYAQFAWVALFVVQILLHRGRHALVMFFGVTFLYGMLLENTGIVMRYFYEPNYRIYLGPLPAPLCTMVGWSLMFYTMVHITQRLAEWIPWVGRGVWRRAFLATILALCLDAQLDPLASMSGVFWRWNELLQPAFFGVPLINYAAWTGAFLPFSYFVFAILDRQDWSPGRRNWELFLRISWAALLGGLICFGLMAIFEGGFDGPTFQILGEFIDRLLPY